MLSLRDVALTYRNGVRALDGVSLDVADGAFVALLGPSGCGKSTLLRLIAGLEKPSRGSVSGAENTSVGFVFQDPTLMPWADALTNARLALDLAHMPRLEADARARDALHAVGLRGFETALPAELSGGMRMRVSLARALAPEPRLLLLDEPFAALDEITRFKLNDDLRTIWMQRKCTVLFVTHSVFESAYLATRVAVMTARPGRIASQRDVDLPASRSVATRTEPAYAALARALSGDLEQATAQ
ncbi:ABC transporter ATP-binding protein [Roseiterribacter gracilis]|uniref:Nitrate/sulfonate/bicarbonate ABC transporter ATP-binding protein n=1 Tax=Roseiterribacter gracilis TaxID=2812848 RepID=A0A8S8XER8_9PROT|nr:nitrate/sulfonate/bicarbonate ABC transporter ATP-binding protein [Rhodospirillales bacterium TMPK1]